MICLIMGMEIQLCSREDGGDQIFLYWQRWMGRAPFTDSLLNQRDELEKSRDFMKEKKKYEYMP